MQIHLQASEVIPTDTIIKSQNKITQLSLQLDGDRYALMKWLGRVFERTNKDIFIDFLDIWLKHNIEMFSVCDRVF